MAEANDKSKLSTDERYRLFANEYVKDFNGGRAAREAKYKAKTAYSQANRLLKNAKVQQYIREAMEKRMKKVEIDAEYVLRRLVEVDQMDAIDILDENFKLKPIQDWPKCWRTTISGLDISKISKGEEDIDEVIKKIKWPDKTKNLELLGKHVNVQAFKEKVEHSADENLMDAILEARNRNSGK